MNDVEAAEMFKKVGGPAYPCKWNLPEDGSLDCPGMTLRDWFAGQALSGCALSDTGTQFRATIAEDAYKIADAMIAERRDMRRR